MKFKASAVILAMLLLSCLKSFPQDKKFYLFLCFGQSNMEGNAKIQPQDSIGIDSRFRVLEAVDCPDLHRDKGNWYTAVPPLCRCKTGLTPADYFGRTMVANLPKDIRVGIINVAVGGCKIELFDKDNYQSYVTTVPVDGHFNDVIMMKIICNSVSHLYPLFVRDIKRLFRFIEFVF